MVCQPNCDKEYWKRKVVSPSRIGFEEGQGRPNPEDEPQYTLDKKARSRSRKLVYLRIQWSHVVIPPIDGNMRVSVNT